MRVLVTAGPLHGHVNTVLPLALAARDAGHQVVVATGPDLVGHVERHGLTAWPVGPPSPAAPVASWIEHFVAAGSRRAVDLVPRALAWHPDLVVSEETEVAGPVAASLAGALTVVHGLGPMPPPALWEGLRPAVERLHRQWGASGVEDLRSTPYLDVCPPALSDGERWWRHSRPVRPAPGSPGPGEQLPQEVTALPAGRTVHLTLGTVFHDAPAVLDAAVTGLVGAGSRGMALDLVVTTGPGTEAPSTWPATVVTAPYLPHALLLPRCRLVVSQAGAGVLFGALAHGLPQLLLPQGADQFGNADAARRAGVALVLAPGEVTAAAVRAAVARLLTEPSFAAAATDAAAGIAAMPTADTVLDELVRQAVTHRAA